MQKDNKKNERGRMRPMEMTMLGNGKQSRKERSWTGDWSGWARDEFCSAL